MLEFTSTNIILEQSNLFKWKKIHETNFRGNGIEVLSSNTLQSILTWSLFSLTLKSRHAEEKTWQTIEKSVNRRQFLALVSDLFLKPLTRLLFELSNTNTIGPIRTNFSSQNSLRKQDSEKKLGAEKSGERSMGRNWWRCWSSVWTSRYHCPTHSQGVFQ